MPQPGLSGLELPLWPPKGNAPDGSHQAWFWVRSTRLTTHPPWSVCVGLFAYRTDDMPAYQLPTSFASSSSSLRTRVYYNTFKVETSWQT